MSAWSQTSQLSYMCYLWYMSPIYIAFKTYIKSWFICHITKICCFLKTSTLRLVSVFKFKFQSYKNKRHKTKQWNWNTMTLACLRTTWRLYCGKITPNICPNNLHVITFESTDQVNKLLCTLINKGRKNSWRHVKCNSMVPCMNLPC